MEVKPGFKPTEVGIIPADWDAVLLFEVCDRISVGLATSVTQHYRNSGVPIIRNLNIKDGYFDGRDMLYITEQFAKANSSKAAKAQDVLTVHTGSNLGDTCVLPAKFDNCQTFTTLITTPQHSRLDPHYLCLHLSSFKGKREIARLQVGGGKGNLNTSDLKKYRVEIPSITEQRAIAAALSDVDALLSGLNRLIAKKRDLKQAAMQQLLTGQTRLPGFSGDWKMKRLGDLFKFSGGYSASRDQLSTEGQCYLHYGDIHGSSKTTIDTRADHQDIPKLNISLKRVSPNSLLMDGDVVFVDASEDDEGTSKHVVVVNKEGLPFIAGLHTIVAKAITTDLTHEYLRYCFQTAAIRLQFKFYAVGTKVSGISKTNIAKLTMPVPPAPEQTAIAAILSDIDAELSTLEARRDKTRALKQAMMQELMTGKTRLVIPEVTHA